MRSVSRGWTLGLFLLSVAGCAAGVRPEALQAWVGRPAAALEQEWGAPTRRVQDGEQQVLIYEEVERAGQRGFEPPADSPPLLTGTAGQWLAAHQASLRDPTVYARSYLFWVNREGTILRAVRRDP
jgi:hypothetical protein